MSIAAAPPAPPPLARAPVFAQDAHELRSVLATQSTEVDVLKGRLSERTRECTQLGQRLRDAEGELEVAADATATATQRLGAHAVRHGLILSAEVERRAVERAALEDEMQGIERLLWERDQEIGRLRKVASDLEASRLQGGMELQGMVASRAAADSEARALGADVTDMLQYYRGAAAGNGPFTGPSRRVVEGMEEVSAALNFKLREHAAVRVRAEAVASEARRLELEENELQETVRLLEYDLKNKQQLLANHDLRTVREGGMLRVENERLRLTLRIEQREAMGVDQRAVLQPQCGMEADAVAREIAVILETVPSLAHALRVRGRTVHSLEVANDPVDGYLHGELRMMAAAGAGVAAPPIVCRLGPGDYLIGNDRVALYLAEGRLMVRSSNGSMSPFRGFMQQQAPHPAIGL